MFQSGAARGYPVALLYLALTLLFAYPLSVDPAHRVMGSPSPDTNLYLWILAWDAHALVRQPLSLFDANIYYPERHTLAYSENLIGSGIVSAPVLWLTHNPVLAMNLLALLSCWLCGLGAYVLARRVGVRRPGAVLSGLVFAFSPPRFLRFDQLHLTTIEWIPFALSFLHAYLDSGRRRDLWLTLAFFTLQALTSGHGAVFLGLAMLLLVFWRGALGEPFAPMRRVRDVGLGGLALIAPAALLALPYVAVQRGMGLRRTLEHWTVSASSFLASPSHVHQWLLSLVPSARINETAGAYLFPGFLPLLLAAIALFPRARSASRAGAGGRWPRAAAALLELAAAVCVAAAVAVLVSGPIRLKAGSIVVLSVRQAWRASLLAALFAAGRVGLARTVPFECAARPVRWREAWTRFARTRRRDPAWFYGLLVGVCLWLCVGPPVGLWPAVYWMPGFNFIRVPSRFVLLAILGLAVLAGLGFDRLARALPPRRAAWAALFAGVLLAGEFACMPLGTDPYKVEIPAIDRWLASEPGSFAIAEVPLANPADLGAFERRETAFMLHSTAHWQKTVHGYSGLRPALHARLYQQLTTFPDERSVHSLQQLGVSYVVVHGDLYPPGEWAAVQRRIGRFGGALTLVHAEGDGRVYRLADIGR